MTNTMRNMGVAIMLSCLLSGCILSVGSKSSAGKADPVVYIHPDSNMYGLSKVGVLPFHVPSNMSNDQGVAVAALFKDVLMAKQAFPVVKQVNTHYGDFEEAMEIGRDAGVDLVMAGSINYFMEGAGFGGAKVDASIRLLNVKTGNTVWYMEQSVSQAVDYPDTGLVNRLFCSFLPQPVGRRPDVAASTTTKMLVRIASAMTDVLKSRP